MKKVLKAMFLTVYQAPLPDGIFGSTYFNSATVDLYARGKNLEAESNMPSSSKNLKENAHVTLDQVEYQKHYNALVARFDKAKSRHTEVTNLIASPFS
ncbi:MAG: hypothetical protein Q4C48_11270 [Lachnospiraceae bacterium]|nr:hypothetical protein [Lachnospiraceae bacterium]